MKRATIRVAALALASVVATGCGGVSDDDATRLLGASPTQAGAPVTATAPSQRLYFGVTNHLEVGTQAPLLTEVNLNAGAIVELEAATADASPLRFEVWQMHEGASTELLNAFDVSSGFVLTSFTAPSDGVFVIRFPAVTSTRQVVIHLDCDRTSGRCTSELQPGERCFEQSACSAGLACAPNDGACDAIWAGGTCVVPNDDTACEGLPTAQVCGCDGVTYGNECLAVASGKGMKTGGACPAAPPPG